jgi:3-hydroxyacyl-[acyl-carrier-protein] dehydratase
MLYNSEQIKEILPHRYPFLLVDRIEEIKSDEAGNLTAIGIKCVTTNEPFFQGHFPSYQVMPGVLILEALAQCGATAVLGTPENKGKLVFFVGANNVKWRYQVTPGDVLRLEVSLSSLKHGLGKGVGKAFVGDKLACSAELAFTIK